MDMDLLTAKKFSKPVQREEVNKSWSQRGFSCSLFVDPPGQEWNNFTHQTNELVTVQQGKLQMTVSGEVLIAEPGDEIFIPVGTLHSVKNIHNESTSWLYGYD